MSRQGDNQDPWPGVKSVCAMTMDSFDLVYSAEKVNRALSTERDQHAYELAQKDTLIRKLEDGSSCLWTENSSTREWDTDCGVKEFQRKAAPVNFCQYCGRKVAVQREGGV